MPPAETPSGPEATAPAVELRLCIDVDDVGRAVHFYTRALGLKAGRWHKEGWAELLGAALPIDVLGKPAGTRASPAATSERHYGRHWTPLHLDVVVKELDVAVARAVALGATLEQPVQVRPWGRMANLADPFGHGFCLLEFQGRGYDEGVG